MKRCAYCGLVNTEETACCTGCGTEFPVPGARWPGLEPTPAGVRKHLLFFRGTYPEGFVRKAPVFGICSIAALPLGFLVALLANSRSEFGGCMGGLAAAGQFFSVLLLAFLLGGASAVAGLWRGERHRGLSLAGLVVNFGSPVSIFLLLWLRA